MKVNTYCVFDSKAGLHLEPFRSMNNATALRAFQDSLKVPESVIARHPEDYCLFYLGTFDNVTGIFDNVERPTNLGTASGLLQ